MMLGSGPLGSLQAQLGTLSVVIVVTSPILGAYAHDYILVGAVDRFASVPAQGRVIDVPAVDRFARVPSDEETS